MVDDKGILAKEIQPWYLQVSIKRRECNSIWPQDKTVS